MHTKPNIGFDNVAAEQPESDSFSSYLNNSWTTVDVLAA